MRRSLAAAVVAAAALLVPATASALTVSTLADGTLRLSASENVRDDVTMRFGGTPLTTLDTPETDTIEFSVYSSAPIVNQAGCTPVSPDTVRCPRAPRYDIDLGGGDDLLNVDLVQRRTTTADWPYAPTIPIGPIAVRDGAGDDMLVFSTFADVTAYGGAGDDDVIAVQAPSVRAVAGPGADLYDSRWEFISNLTVDYSAYAVPVSVTTDFTNDDGAAGEHDTVRAVRAVIGGSGNDTLNCSWYILGAQESVLGGPGDDVVSGGDGNDLLDGGPGADRISGGAGTDRVTYESRTAPVSLTLDDIANDGEPGEGDSIEADVEELQGGAGNDVLSGNQGADRLDGGPGADTVSYASATRPVRVTLARDATTDDGADGEGDDVVAVEHVIGGPFDDVLSGDDGSNRFDGGGGSDVLDGAGGADQLIGGPGSGDRVDYGRRSASVRATIDARADDGEAGERDRVDVSVEEVVGGSGADTLIGTERGDALSGGPGNDRIDGRGGDDNLLGGGGTDVLTGGAGSDAIGAVDGVRDTVVCDSADYVATDARDATTRCAQRVVGVVPAGLTVHAAARSRSGTSRADVLRGTASRDRIWGKRGNDRIAGGGGDDRLHGGTGVDRVAGDGGNDLVAGDEAPDLLFGGAGDDHLLGWTGSDRLDGGPGDDVSDGGSGDDLIIGGAGNDRSFGNYGHDDLRGGSGDDDLSGNAAPDVLSGERGNDALNGGSGVDRLVGGEGNDDLIGGSGPDVLIGGRGDDTLYLNDNDVDRRVECGPGDDTVYVDPRNTANGIKDRLLLAKTAANCEHQIELAPGQDTTFDGAVILTADTGEARAGTELSDKLLGGLGPDILHAGAGNDLLWGDRSPGPASPDVIRGGAGDDTMYGGGADDIVDGGAGNDMVQGDNGADRLFGGPGADLLRPAAGRDVVFGGAGPDVVHSEADGAVDVVDCGPGKDVAHVDRIDRVRGCESVRYR
ncbi:MAG: calcium-binding protein [Baekduia sp.]